MHRRKTKSLPSDSDEDEPLSKMAEGKRATVVSDESSSDSDIGNYLQRVDEIDLNSSFFNTDSLQPPSFEKIEEDIFSGVSRMTDSESEEEEDEEDSPKEAAQPSTSKLNFQQLYDYSKKLEEVKRHVEKYNAKKRAREKLVNVSTLLAAGESKVQDQETPEETFRDLESDCDEDWEEVEEKQQEPHAVPKEGLQITLEMPTTIRKKKSVDLLAAIKRRINRVRKENQVLVHKVHLLCWLAHGNYVSSVINSQNVLAVALSLLPSQQCYPANRTDLSYLEQILKWYGNAVVNVDKPQKSNISLSEALEEQISKKAARNKEMLVYIFVAILRSLGIQCRLVLSLQVEPLRPPESELHSLSTKNSTPAKKVIVKSTKSKEMSNNTKNSSKVFRVRTKDESKPKSQSVEELKVKESKSKGKSKSKAKNAEEGPKALDRASANNVSKAKTKVTKKESKPKDKSDEMLKNAGEEFKSKVSKAKTKNTKVESKTPEGEVSKSRKTRSTSSIKQSKKEVKTSKIPQLDGANDTGKPSKPNLKKLNNEGTPCPVKTHPKRLQAPIKYRDTDSEDEFTPKTPKKNTDCRVNLQRLRNVTSKALDVRKDIVDLVVGRIKQQKEIDRSKTVRKRRSLRSDENDDDYVPEAVKKKRESEDDFTPAVKVKKRVKTRKDAEDEAAKSTKRRGVDVWAEVFLEAEEKWISVDVVKAQVHCVNELYARATHPVAYVVAWNNDNTIKDITRRYCQNFNTVTRKLRIDAKWWGESLRPFLAQSTARDREEDEELERLQLDKPLPTSIAEYKNHPLYVLKRHLLKFEALYPPDASTLGFVRKEPVYSRQCVYTLHSRDLWLKHAKVVKPGEQPYKIVKARPRWDKLSNSIVTGEMLEIFGPWQTQDYEPPTAENGVVPRNAFGNVELFKPCMLPKKTAHLQLPGLNKVARRMNMDCAPALVGFDFHGGWNHPTYDGYVVCEEHADVLIAAWELEQDELVKREQEKLEKRVYGNWKKLIKGLLIRERLKAKYDFGAPSSGKNKTKEDPKLVTRKRKIESDSD